MRIPVIADHTANEKISYSVMNILKIKHLNTFEANVDVCQR